MWSSPSNTGKSDGSQNGKTFGLTSAISTAPPKPRDIALTRELEETIKKFDIYESEEEYFHRYFKVSSFDVWTRGNLLVKDAQYFPISFYFQIGRAF